MKHVFMVFAAAILIFGVAMAASAQSATGLNESSQSNGIQATGVIVKIDPQSRTITIGDFAVSSNSPEPTGSPNAPADQPNADSAETTQVLKYSEHTNFASTNPEQMNGRMSDLQVGDSVMLQVDNQNNILRIEEINSPPQNQQ
jgi:Cu/Ag efflux protein CusF